MKNSAMIRIIIFSVLTVVLVAALVFGLVGNGFGFFKDFSFGFSYENADLYKAGNCSLSTENIKKLDVNWVSDSIKISTHSGDEIIVEETNSEQREEKNKLHYYVNGDGVLFVQFSASRGFFSFGNLDLEDKNLTILIPESDRDLMKTISVDSVSAEINIEKIKTDTLNLDSVSGSVHVSDIGDTEKITVDTTSGEIDITADSDSVEMDTVSGEINYNGLVKDEFKCNTISGEVTLQSKDCPDKVDIDSVSGSITLVLSAECGGFTANTDSVSGGFRCEFPTTGDDDDEVVYGNGDADFSFDTVSGSVRIKKG